ncbi:MAG TPA: HD domain-containing protein [Acidimicrobiales bacterium]
MGDGNPPAAGGPVAGEPTPGETERSARWASTMSGYSGPVRLAHADSSARIGPAADPATPSGRAPRAAPSSRLERQELEDELLAPGATRASGAGDRAVAEEADPWRTCFERDRDRILHATSFRRLAGKTQVFVFPEDHQRTRLTHALEVAQVATAMARACRLNVALTEAIALGHDCGHGPGGHASEDALDPYLPDGFDHAPWGAHVSLAPLNLCAQTVDAIANHSWSRPAPSTPEGEVVSWADRIAYVCHDWEDAVAAGIVAPHQLPAEVRASSGERRSAQLGAFIGGVVSATLRTGQVGMEEDTAEALAAFRACNYERIYLRDASLRQGEAVVAVLRALVDHFADRPHLITDAGADAAPPDIVAGSDRAVRAAVTYVAGMTDRFAFRLAVAQLGWDPAKLPTGVGS